jgi:hypothetical protein
MVLAECGAMVGWYWRSTGRETCHSATWYTTSLMYCDAVYCVNYLISVLIFFKISAAIRCNTLQYVAILLKKASILGAKCRRFLLLLRTAGMGETEMLPVGWMVTYCRRAGEPGGE